MDVVLDLGKEHPHLSIVTKRLRDESGSPIGRRHGNPILDSRLYEVEFSYGEKMSLAENEISENMFDQVDEQGHRHVIMDKLFDLRTNGNQVRKDDAFITLRSGAKRRKENTNSW